jgi:hypothetical protein
MIGVHVIIMGQVVMSDVVIFGFLMLLVACGVGSGFALVLAAYDAQLGEQYPNGGREFSRPFFIPLWALLEPPEVTIIEEAVGSELPSRYTLGIGLFTYAFFLLVLINLLIAAMTETYQRLRQESTLYYLDERGMPRGGSHRRAVRLVWRALLTTPRLALRLASAAARLIEEFKRKGALPPPLNIISLFLNDVPRTTEMLLRRCGCVRFKGCLTRWSSGVKPRDGFKLLPGPEQQRALYRSGRAVLKRYMLRQKKLEQKKLDYQMVKLQKQMGERFDHHNKHFDLLRMHLGATNERMQRVEMLLSFGADAAGARPAEDVRSVSVAPGAGDVRRPSLTAACLNGSRRGSRVVGSADAVHACGVPAPKVLTSVQRVVMAARAAAAAAAAQEEAERAVAPAAPCRAGTQEAIDNVQTIRAMPVAAGCMHVTPARDERNELKQEGEESGAARPLKAKAPSERQKRKPMRPQRAAAGAAAVAAAVQSSLTRTCASSPATPAPDALVQATAASKSAAGALDA